tara:strand:+ start:973 stop:1284 length:312 start_codon:yes stop_codon:yes gene_type:complete
MTYSIDLREKVISFIADGGSKSEAVRIFKISRDTLYRWLNAEDLRPKVHGERNRKIDKVALRKHVEDHPDMYLHERSALFNVGISGMHYALKRLGIVKKRTSV